MAGEAVEIHQVSEVHSISGQWDLLIKCFLEDDDDIGHFVTETLQLVPGVKDTFTMLTFRAFSSQLRQTN